MQTNTFKNGAEHMLSTMHIMKLVTYLHPALLLAGKMNLAEQHIGYHIGLCFIVTFV